MSVTVAYTVALEVIECYACGVMFGMTTYQQKERLNDKKSFYCPNGHQQAYTGKSLAVQLADEQQRVRQERMAREMAERNTERERASKERLRKRIAKGVCPNCNRTFLNVARHCKTKHPELVR